MIKVEKLCKSFRTEDVETIALNKVSFEVKDGEFLAIMGPSGCGKSTLLNILGLLDNPTSGEYWLDGQELGSLKEKERTIVRKGNIGFIFQFFHLIPRLTAQQNIELPLLLADPYFNHDDVRVFQVEDVNPLIDMGHAIQIHRKGGASGIDHVA